MDNSAQPTLMRRLADQGRWCGLLGSPLYEHLLARAVADVEAGGPVSAVLAGHEHDAEDSALALRLMGAVHRVVLEGRAPELARHYPSAGGAAGIAAAWEAFRATVDRERDALRELVERPVQTNEVARCAALLGGFLAVADATRLPLRLLELGASAGLHLRFDRYRCGDRGRPPRAGGARPRGRGRLAGRPAW
jgi:hypothetical protein